MSMMTKKFDENEMLNMLSQLLVGGEQITTALYCLFKQTGFFASNRNLIIGYVALTDNNRLIGWKMDVFETKPVVLDMYCIKKIKISNALLGQKIVYLKAEDGKKTEVKFRYAPKVFGSQEKFPNQERNSEIFLDELRAIESRL